MQPIDVNQLLNEWRASPDFYFRWREGKAAEEEVE